MVYVPYVYTRKEYWLLERGEGGGWKHRRKEKVAVSEVRGLRENGEQIEIRRR